MCCLCRFFDCFLGGGSGGLNGLCNRAGLGLDISRINNTAYLNHTARRLLLRCLDLHLLVLAFCHHGRMLGFQSDVSNGRVKTDACRTDAGVCAEKNRWSHHETVFPAGKWKAHLRFAWKIYWAAFTNFHYVHCVHCVQSERL